MRSNPITGGNPPGGANHIQLGSRNSRGSINSEEEQAQTNKKSWYILAGAAAISFVVVSTTLMYSKILAVALTALSIVSVFFTIVAYGAYKSESRNRVQYIGDLIHASEQSFIYLQQFADKGIRLLVDKVYPNPLPN